MLNEVCFEKNHKITVIKQQVTHKTDKYLKISKPNVLNSIYFNDCELLQWQRKNKEISKISIFSHQECGI